MARWPRQVVSDPTCLAVPRGEKAFQCGASDAAILSRASAISFAYSPAESSPRISWKRWYSEIRVGDVGLAVVADRAISPRATAAATSLPSMPSLPGKPHSCAISSSGVRARLVHREHVHQVEVARVVAAEVVVELEVAVLVALVPVRRAGDAVDQRAVIAAPAGRSRRRSTTRAAACTSRCRRRSAG